MNRDEFKTLAKSIYNNGSWPKDIDDNKEPFWIPEFREGWKASVFLEVQFVAPSTTNKEFWNWCRNNLSKNPMCFMSDTDNNIEWWGFNTEADAVLFVLRWS